MKISVILPVYSEKETLPHITERLSSLLKEKLHEILFIVSPDSLQETFSIIRELCKKYSFVNSQLQQENPGLGLAIRQGLSAASGTHMLMMGSDGETDTETIPAMINKMLETGCDMVVAGRWIRGGGAKGYNPIKYFLNRGFQFIFRLLYRTTIHDLTLGFKLIDKEKANNIKWNSTFNEIDVETTLRPLKAGYHIEEVPTVWIRRQSGTSKNPFRHNFRYVKKALEILLAG